MPSRSSRGSRPRTRWFAIVPDDRGDMATNTGATDEIIIRDLEGTVQFNDLVGGTLLKVLLTMETNPVLTYPANISAGYSTDHHGLFMTEDSNPSATAGAAWDPNIPFGSFMIRWSSAYRIRMGYTDSIMSELMSQNDGRQSSSGPQILISTEVQRRITENDRLFVAHYHFEDTVVVTGVEFGWSGRVLVRLP